MRKPSLKTINIVLLVCAGACLVCYDCFGGLWLKGVTSSWFVALGAVNVCSVRKLEWKRLRYFLLMLLGLVCGMCADVLLGVTFFAGVGVFALGHVAYLVAFCLQERFTRRDLLFILPLALISVYVAIGTPFIRVEDPLLEKLLIGYALIISAMLGKCLSNLRRCPSLSRRLMAVGCVLFWFSDLMLAIDMFGQPSRLTWILCSYSYWPAQSILAHSLFHTGLELASEKHPDQKVG